MEKTRQMQGFILDMFNKVSESHPRHKHEHILASHGIQFSSYFETETFLKSEGLGVLKKGKIFSPFNNEHMDEAFKAIKYLNDTKLDTKSLIIKIVGLHMLLNEELFVYVTSYVIINHPDFKTVHLPPYQEIFPDKFIHKETISKIKRQVIHNGKDSKKEIVIPADFSGDNLDPEHRLAYWREDIQLNSHHWNWHLVYPTDWTPDSGEGLRDRKGELFYYMHQQLVARYNCERLSVHYPRVTAFFEWDEPIVEGYNSHLLKENSGINYGPRPGNMILQDLPNLTKSILRAWYQRIMQSIHLGYLTSREYNTHIPLNNEGGIDKIGAIVEASRLSVNYDFYGNLHNMSHNSLSRIHDPDERYKGDPGVMGDVATTVRDPIFFRWHKFIDDIFQEHKLQLPSYNEEGLMFKDIIVKSVDTEGKQNNQLQTFWEESTLDMKYGLAFECGSPIVVRYRHLQHEQFNWSIIVENISNEKKQGMVRIFMAPKYDVTGNQFTPNELRKLMIEMDKFEFTFEAKKTVIVTRKSRDSSVIIPDAKTTQNIREELQKDDPWQHYCGCGLPSHLLVPRGKREGMNFMTFVMITDATKDKVYEEDDDVCKTAPSYCGILNKKYPDKRAMGFPFDRQISDNSWQKFQKPNMSVENLNSDLLVIVNRAVKNSLAIL
uniref:PPO3 n=1 Tax=Scolopendra dehaani TaxID=2609776 RepID=A0A212MHW1_SCODE|nr:PPO3 [Scolopendra dehaani]